MSATPLRLFVYGTLKRGQRSHAQFCSGAVAIEPATVVGRLFHVPVGYPILVVPEQSIVAVGTRDPVADLATQQRWDEIARGATGQVPSHTLVEDPKNSADWNSIEGEVLSFPDPSRVLPRLDLLEDYRPESSETTYIRALVPLGGSGSSYVWTYVAPCGRLPQGAKRIERRWP